MTKETRSTKETSHLIFKAISDILADKKGVTRKLVRETCLKYDVNEKHIKTIMEI